MYSQRAGGNANSLGTVLINVLFVVFTHCFSHFTVDYLFSRVVRVDCTTQSAGNKADLSRGSADCGAEVLSADLTPLASYYTNQLFRHDRAHRDGARVSRWQNTADPPT